MIAQVRWRGGCSRYSAWIFGGLAMVLISSGARALYMEGNRWPAGLDGITRIPGLLHPLGRTDRR